MRLKALLCCLLLSVVTACHRPPEPPSDNNAANAVASDDAGAFQPLQSDAVKDAMHRALRTGQTQRLQDGKFSGYAVPGPTGKNGCRAIRYTIDQCPEVPFESIPACEAN